MRITIKLLSEHLVDAGSELALGRRTPSQGQLMAGQP